MRKTQLMIQVAPGVKVPLRGSEETWEAINEDFYVPCICIGCQTTLCVIQDAAYLLCPSCRTISPMEGHFVDHTLAGVGMGFRLEELMRWQNEILQERTCYHGEGPVQSVAQGA